MPFCVWIAGFLIASGGFGPAAAADQPDTVVAVQPGGPGVLTKCRDWLVARSCHHYHHISLPSRVAIGDTITVELAGTSPQTLGPTNVGPAMAPTGAFTIIKSFLDPGSDVNSGAFRPLTVITPPGTIVNANPPAPCGGMVEV